jgi:hypothetical protein
MYIDGYVDVAKGAWIIDLGATPNVASTFMFLEKIGVPSNIVAYFMNQPMIQDYLQNIEQSGGVWLFRQDILDDMMIDPKYMVENPATLKVNTLEKDKNKLATLLRNNVGKEKFTDAEKAQQHFMLNEFLKYAKMASHLFNVTQGTNYDTTTFNDPYLLFKKSVQFEKAQDTMIVSANNIMDNSFIGKKLSKIQEMQWLSFYLQKVIE